MADILVIDDDESSLILLKNSLEPEHKAVICPRIKRAWEILEERSFDLILLDVDLPDGDGFEFFSQIKKNERFDSIPVVFVSGKNTISDQVLGLSLGAEDYIVKPIYPLLLQAKINARLAKTQKFDDKAQIFGIGPLKFDILKQRCFVLSEDSKRELALTSLEFKLLLYLTRREDQIFSRDQLMTAIWGENVNIMDRTIDTHISHLRTKLRGSSVTIEAVHGAGYRLMRTGAAATRLAA